ncbi:MAG: glycosyltransferase family 39 protein, partial [Bryobacteraceae bacterium]
SATPQVWVRLVNGNFVLPCPPHFFQNCPADLHKYLPIRRTRLATGALSLIGILFTGLAAFEITRSTSSAVIAAALIGFLPQFDFRGATVNNDAAVAVFCAVATYFIARMAVRGFEKLPAILGSIALALAFLSKINAVAVVPAFVTCLLLTSPDWKTRARRLMVLVIPAIVILPWLVRNKILYGDVLASNVMLRTVPGLVQKRSLTDPYFSTTFPTVTVQSFIGYFGWINVRLPESIYKGFEVLFYVAVFGVLFMLLGSRKYVRVVALLASIPILSAVIMIDFNMTFPQPQGRLLFPCLSALAILMALGLTAISRGRRYVAIVVALGCLSVNIYALTNVIYPAYWRAKPAFDMPDATVPDTMMKGRPPGPLLPGHKFTQSFTAEHDDLSAVDIEVAEYAKARSGSLTISLSDSEKGPILASTEIPAAKIPQCCTYQRLSFAPLPHSAGKQYFVSLSTKGLTLPAALTVFLSGTNVYRDGEFFVDGKPTGQDTSFRTFYTPAESVCASCP